MYSHVLLNSNEFFYDSRQSSFIQTSIEEVWEWGRDETDLGIRSSRVSEPSSRIMQISVEDSCTSRSGSTLGCTRRPWTLAYLMSKT